MGWQTGDRMPFFEVVTTDGRRTAYREWWQRRNVLLVVVPPDGAWEPYVAALEARRPDIEEHDTVLVMTADVLDGLRAPGLAIADRWGEIHHVQTVGDQAPTSGHPGAPVPEMPSVDAVLEWLRYVQHKCPECEGESR